MTHATQARITALVAAGLLATTGVAAAHADTTTSGNGSIGGGNQVDLDVDAPINVCGNSIAVLGMSGADCTDGGAAVGHGGGPTGSSSTSAPGDGYDGHTPGEEGEPGGEEQSAEEESPVAESPSAAEEEAPREEQPAGAPEEAASSTSGAVDEAADPGRDAASGQAGVDASGQGELARTGVAGLTAWLAAGAAAVAAGAGLIVFGLRRAHR
jgi:hypothetical protein